MSDIVIKVSPPHIDVKTALDKDLVVSSSKKCLKMSNVKKFTITTDGNGYFNDILFTHNLGLIPITQLVINRAGAFYFEPIIMQIDDYFSFSSWADVFNISVFVGDYYHPNSTFDIYLWISETEGAV